MALENSLSFNVKVYFSLTQSYRKIVQYLAQLTLHAMKVGWKGVWPSIKKILFRIKGMCERTVQRFNSEVNGLFIDVIARFNQNGRQTSNQYKFNPEFWRALKWLSQRNLLNIPEDRHEAIIKEAEKYEKKLMSPSPSLEGMSPLYSNSSYLNSFKRGFVHPKLQEVRGLSEMNKEILSREPESLLMLALEDALKFKETILWPRAYLMKRIQKYREKRSSLLQNAKIVLNL